MIPSSLQDPATLAPAFAAAQPFPHVVLDGFFAPETAKVLSHVFPTDPERERWRAGIHRHSRKWTKNTYLGADVERVIGNLHAPFLLKWLERVSGIHPILPDHTLRGGGLHLSLPGSYLDIHADFTHNESRTLRRCLNLLVYLSPDYEPAWGGRLELWDQRLRRCVQSIEPRFNRAVLFQTSPTSYHGHPDPMGGPPGARRRSLALYYYTPSHLDDEILETTDYRARPWEYGERLRKWAGRLKRAVTA